MNKFIHFLQKIFPSDTKLLEQRVRKLALQTTQYFDTLQTIMKNGEYVIADHRKVANDREQFLRDNSQTQVDQNVSRNTDNKRAFKLLTGVMLIGCILSVKGLKYFFGEFYASMSMLMIIPIALTLAGVIVVGSIYLNNFANSYILDQNKPTATFILLKLSAYGMVLFIPSMNLLEGLDSQYSPIVMSLNLIACAIDVSLHASLVTMSRVFITAENSKQAIKEMQQKDKALASVDKKLHAFNTSFIKAKAEFTSSAKQFVSSFKELQAMNATTASNTLYLLDNFTIWMLNNKVMQHALIPYHADDNGHPVVELRYFTPEQDSIRHGWDMLSLVRVDNTNNQQTETLNGQRQVTELPVANEAAQQQQEQVPVQDTRVYEPGNEESESQPADYDAMLDNVNPNDKTL